MTPTVIATKAEQHENAHRSRWGYHSCGRETFLLFKEFHRYMLHDLRRTRAWERWNAKMPENRRGNEPACMGTGHDLYEWTLQEYRNARTPVLTPALAPKFDPPPTWTVRLSKLRELHGDIRPKR
jgi:hypothetical protein